MARSGGRSAAWLAGSTAGKRGVGWLAAAGVASQSSSQGTYSAKHAIDGNFASFSHTIDIGQQEAWWQVALAEAVHVGLVKLWANAAECSSRFFIESRTAPRTWRK